MNFSPGVTDFVASNHNLFSNSTQCALEGYCGTITFALPKKTFTLHLFPLIDFNTVVVSETLFPLKSKENENSTFLFERLKDLHKHDVCQTNIFSKIKCQLLKVLTNLKTINNMICIHGQCRYALLFFNRITTTPFSLI